MFRLFYLTVLAPTLIAAAILPLVVLPALARWAYPGMLLPQLMAFVLAIANAVLLTCLVQWLARRWETGGALSAKEQ